MIGKLRIIVVTFLLLLLVPFYASALVEEKSSIVGTFKEEAGVSVEGIAVRLLDGFSLNEVARTITDRNGRFVLPNLIPGLYLISIDAASMKGAFKRIQVEAGTPTIIDIRPLMNDEDKKEHNAWDRFKWTIRMAERNPLRNEIYPVHDESEDDDTDGLLAFLKDFQEANNIEGAFSYVSVGAGPLTSNMTHQMAQFAVQGDLEGEGGWSFNGNFLTGQHSSYMAAGDVRYALFDHELGVTFSANDLVFAQFPDLLERQKISRFVQSTSEADLANESSRWVSSLNIQDRWELIERLKLGYGVRIDYYGYMIDSMHYSPRVGASYELTPGINIHGAYFINSSAPGNFYLQPEEINPYIHDIAFVPYGSTLAPERAEGIESGIDFSGQDYRFSVVYSYQDIQNKIATVDLRNTPVNDHLQSMRPFVIFNASDLNAHVVQAQVQKRISGILTALGSYNITESVPLYIVEKGSFSKRQVYFRKGETSEDFHDVQAGIRANINQTKTQVQANWKWSSGSPLVFGRRAENSALTALDLEVYQGIPFQVFSESDIKFLLAVKNLLDQNSDGNGNADYQRALVYGMPRVIAGGVLIEF
jgi:hypothetical protein